MTIPFRNAVLMLVLMAGFVTSQFGGAWPADMSALYFGARAFGLGLIDVVYAAPVDFFSGLGIEDPVWRQMPIELGVADQDIAPFIYPPLVAAVLSPIAMVLRPETFFSVMLAVNLGASAASILLAWRIACRATGADIRVDRWVAGSLALFGVSFPFAIAYFYAQPQIIVTFLILLAFDRLQAGKGLQAGIWLAVAASIKLSPALFGVIFIGNRDWRACIGAVMAGAVFLGLSVGLAGWPLHLDFVDRLGHIAQSGQVLSNINFGVEAAISVLGTYFGPTPETLGSGGVFTLAAHHPGGQWVARGLLLASVALIAVLPNPQGAAQTYWRLVFLWAVVVVVSPLAWAHLAMGVLFLAPGIWALVSRWGAVVMLGGTGLCLIYWVPALIFGWGEVLPYIQGLLGCAVLLVWVGFAGWRVMWPVNPPKPQG